ncbi:unannotated protein [freshwater metagenome]|uniref:Unannotated protein n=1 Tax=freshwater metagenome TaxID=449393 RepID=A0A6J6B5P4_9ZZZZ
MVDVVGSQHDFDVLASTLAGDGRLAFVQSDEVLDRRLDVGQCEHRLGDRKFEAELAVELVPADLGKVESLRVEVEVIEKRTRSFERNLLARTKLLVDVLERVFGGQDVVVAEGLFHRVRPGEFLFDLFARHAESLEEHGHRLATLAIDANTDLVALVNFEFEPRTAARDNTAREKVLVGRLVVDLLKINTRATDEL